MLAGQQINLWLDVSIDLKSVSRHVSFVLCHSALRELVRKSVLPMPLLFVFLYPLMGGFLVNCLKSVPLELGKCLVLMAWGVLESSTFVVDLLQNQSESCIPTFLE